MLVEMTGDIQGLKREWMTDTVQQPLIRTSLVDLSHT